METIPQLNYSRVCHFALLHGLMTREEVIDWADSVIMQLDKPPYALLELSICPVVSAMITLLHELSDTTQTPFPTQPILILLAQRLQQHPTKIHRVWDILRELFYQYPDEWSEQQKNEFYHLDYGFELIPEGYTTLSQMQQELGAFLNRYGQVGELG